MTSKLFLTGVFGLLMAQVVAQSYDVAAYVWPAYQPESRWAELGIFKAGKGEWQNVWEAAPKWEGHEQPRKPLWGYENEADPKVVEKKIDAAVSHGVNVFIYDWYWYGGRPFLEDALDKGFLGAPNNARMKFFIMWANHNVVNLWDNKVAEKDWNHPIWPSAVSTNEFRALAQRWISMYFKRPNYYRIAGKPVLMIYELKTFVDGVGGLDKAEECIRYLRTECRRAGLDGLHLMACDYGLKSGLVSRLGVDSATIYNFVHWCDPGRNLDYADWAGRAMGRFDVARRELGLNAYFPHVSVGWDPNPRYPSRKIMPVITDSTPRKFGDALRRAKSWCDRNCGQGGPKLITVNSWNEWTEGSYLEPDERNGLAYLKEIEKVFVAAATPLLSPVEIDVARASADAYVFADRKFMFSDEALEFLEGRKFFLWTINESPALEILRDGELLVMTPSTGEKDSHAAELSALGFAKVSRDGIRPFVADGQKSGKAEIWRKLMRKGEKLPKFWPWAVVAGFDDANQPWKWSPEADARRARVAERILNTEQRPRPLELLINKPDYIVFVPEQPQFRRRRRADRVGDTYNDHFHVLCDDTRKILYAFWTQASDEGDIDEHIAFSKSTDNGRSWSTPRILAGSPTRRNPQLRACWQQPMLAKSGRLYCLWCQAGVRKGCAGYMFGVYSDDCGETWSEPEYCPFAARADKDPKNPMEGPCWLNWQRPLRLGRGGRYLAATSRWGWADYESPDRDCNCVVDFMQFDNIDDNPPVGGIKVSQFSLDRAALRVGKTGKFAPICEEGSIVKLPDGRLFCLMRTSIGHPVWSQSRDDGVTWSKPEILRRKDGGEPFLHPQSPCPIYDWKGCEAASGTYFALIHNRFDFNADTPMQRRTELYLIAGKFNPDAKNQPIEFAEPRLFAPRPGGNSFYTSYCTVDGKGVLWFPDMKYYLLGRIVGPEWFSEVTENP